MIDDLAPIGSSQYGLEQVAQGNDQCAAANERLQAAEVCERSTRPATTPPIVAASSQAIVSSRAVGASGIRIRMSRDVIGSRASAAPRAQPAMSDRGREPEVIQARQIGR